MKPKILPRGMKLKTVHGEEVTYLKLLGDGAMVEVINSNGKLDAYTKQTLIIPEGFVMT